MKFPKDFIFVTDDFIPPEESFDEDYPEEISMVNFHTALALLFMVGPQLTKHKKTHALFSEALKHLDELGQEKTYIKLQHRYPLKITLPAIKLYAKELLAKD
jgi:uncharacterized protein (UPF0332 family)